MIGTELRETAKNKKKKPQVLIEYRCDATAEKVTTISVGILLKMPREREIEKVDKSNISILDVPILSLVIESGNHILRTILTNCYLSIKIEGF